MSDQVRVSIGRLTAELSPPDTVGWIGDGRLLRQSDFTDLDWLALLRWLGDRVAKPSAHTLERIESALLEMYT